MDPDGNALGEPSLAPPGLALGDRAVLAMLDDDEEVADEHAARVKQTTAAARARVARAEGSRRLVTAPWSHPEAVAHHHHSPGAARPELASLLLMRVHVGSDHAGFELKAVLLDRLPASGFDVADHGAFVPDPTDDYPKFCIATALAVVADPGSLGIVIGGSGNGEQIAANKVVGVRAALVWSDETAQLARQHNDANVMAIGARMHDVETAAALVERFLATAFSEDPRHVRRIDQVARYEAGRWT